MLNPKAKASAIVVPTPKVLKVPQNRELIADFKYLAHTKDGIERSKRIKGPFFGISIA